jgi:hypothetical protein
MRDSGEFFHTRRIRIRSSLECASLSWALLQFTNLSHNQTYCGWYASYNSRMKSPTQSEIRIDLTINLRKHRRITSQINRTTWVY